MFHTWQKHSGKLLWVDLNLRKKYLKTKTNINIKFYKKQKNVCGGLYKKR